MDTLFVIGKDLELYCKFIFEIQILSQTQYWFDKCLFLSQFWKVFMLTML